MTVKELKEQLNHFDEEKELILFAEDIIPNGRNYTARELDILTVNLNGDYVQLFMQYEERMIL